jgi:hypothetical protein
MCLLVIRSSYINQIVLFSNRFAMFICVGHNKKRLSMSMQSVYVDDEMYDKALPHLNGTSYSLMHRDGTVSPVSIMPGVSLEFAPGLFTRINNEDELRLASRLVVLYHDSLRTESEQFEVNEHLRDMEETALMEEACLLRMQDMHDEDDADSYYTT